MAILFHALLPSARQPTRHTLDEVAHDRANPTMPRRSTAAYPTPSNNGQTLALSPIPIPPKPPPRCPKFSMRRIQMHLIGCHAEKEAIGSGY